MDFNYWTLFLDSNGAICAITEGMPGSGGREYYLNYNGDISYKEIAVYPEADSTPKSDKEK